MLFLLCIINVLIRFFAADIVYFLAFLFFKDETSAKQILEQVFASDTTQGLIFSSCFYIFEALPFFIYALLNKDKYSDLASLKPPKAGPTICAVFISLTGAYAVLFIFNLLYLLLERFGFRLPDLSTPVPTKPFDMALYIFMIAVLPAFFEEFIYRGIIMGSLKKYSKGFAIFVSAFIFGTIHMTFQQVPMAFAVGLLIGFFVVKFDSIWIGVIIHFINNLSSAVISLLEPHVSENVFAAISLLTVLTVGTIGLALGAVFLSKYGISLKDNKPAEPVLYANSEYNNTTQPVLNKKHRTRSFFTSPVMYVYLCLVIFVMILSYIMS